MQFILPPKLRSVLTILLAMVSMVMVTPAQDLRSSPEELTRKTGEGEECIVCGQSIVGAEVVALRMDGRRFFVDTRMLEDFLAEPERYFQKLRAKTALFDESGTDTGLGDWPFWIGTYLLMGWVFAAICGYLAVGAGIAPVPWFFAGLAGNIAALCVLLAARRGRGEWSAPPGLAKVPTTEVPATCGSCGGFNHPSAESCASCAASLAPAKPSEVVLLRGSQF